MAAYLIIRVFFAALRLLPPSWAAALGRGLAGAWGRLDRRHLEIALINLDIAFPDLPESAKRRIALDSYRNIGECYGLMSQFPKFLRMKPERLRRWIRYEGLDAYLEAKRQGKPVLVLTGHLGLWEFMAFGHALLYRSLHFIVRPVKNRRIDRFLNGYRMMSGNTAIPKREALKAVLRAFTDKGDVGILADQDAHARDGVFVDFFGKAACTIKGPALMAARGNAAVFPVFMVEDETRQARYCIRVLTEVDLQRSGDLEADTQENTRRMMAAFEEAVRRWPGRWLWFHRRWKTRPPGDMESVYARRAPR